MSSVNEVHAALDHECEIQRGDYGDNRPVEDWLIYIVARLHPAIGIGCFRPDGEAMQTYFIRRLAALCILCMEDNGVVFRHGLREPVFGPVSREIVYAAIDGERAYQDSLTPDRTDGRQHTVNGYLCMFHTYLSRAINGWTETAGDTTALDNIRKLAGIAVHCLEDHGVGA